MHTQTDTYTRTHTHKKTDRQTDRHIHIYCIVGKFGGENVWRISFQAFGEKKANE